MNVKVLERPVQVVIAQNKNKKIALNILFEKAEKELCENKKQKLKSLAYKNSETYKKEKYLPQVFLSKFEKIFYECWLNSYIAEWWYAP